MAASAHGPSATYNRDQVDAAGSTPRRRTVAAWPLPQPASRRRLPKMMASMRAPSVGITSGDLEAAGAKETRVIDRGRQQRPSVFDVVKARVGTSAEKQGFCPYFRAAVALYGSICFWVGAWSIIDHQLNGVCFLLGQHLRDIAIGVAMLIASDT